MRTMPPVMRRGNRRTSRQNHTRHENRECLDDLVHITPATFCFRFPAGALLPLTERQEIGPLLSDNISRHTLPRLILRQTIIIKWAVLRSFFLCAVSNLF